MVATIFMIAVTIVILGWLWFYVARPILVDFGIIGVNTSVEDSADSEQVAGATAPGSASSSRWVEPAGIAETHQLEPNDPAVYEPAADPLMISHKMSRKELTILLAAQKDSDGAYRFSANKIAEFIGGTSAEVKGWVADVRGRREPAATTLRRPANGW